jgi:uncharacterized protein with PhoU and TrkA domain
MGRSLRELELPRRDRVSVIAVRDVLTDEMIAVPDPNARLKESDTLIVGRRDDDLSRAAKIG